MRKNISSILLVLLLICLPISKVIANSCDSFLFTATNKTDGEINVSGVYMEWIKQKESSLSYSESIPPGKSFTVTVKGGDHDNTWIHMDVSKPQTSSFSYTVVKDKHSGTLSQTPGLYHINQGPIGNNPALKIRVTNMDVGNCGQVRDPIGKVTVDIITT
jgi:hypothetical protein